MIRSKDSQESAAGAIAQVGRGDDDDDDDDDDFELDWFVDQALPKVRIFIVLSVSSFLYRLLSLSLSVYIRLTTVKRFPYPDLNTDLPIA